VVLLRQALQGLPTLGFALSQKGQRNARTVMRRCKHSITLTPEVLTQRLNVFLRQ